MGDVCKRTAMHQRGGSLSGLYKIGEQGLTQQSPRRPGRLQVDCPHRLPATVLADHNARQARTQILAIRSQRQDGHDLRRRCNQKSTGTIAAVTLPPLRYAQGDLPERTVVHVQGAWPSDPAWIKIELVAVKQVRVNQGGQKIVRGGDRMKVSVEVQID